MTKKKFNLFNLTKTNKEDIFAKIKKEKEEKDAIIQSFLNSDRFNEIINLMILFDKSSFNADDIFYQKDNSVFKDTDEFYLFCKCIENYKECYPEEGDFSDVIYYFNELFCLVIFSGQGTSKIIRKLKSPVIKKQNVFLGKDNFNENYGYYRVDFKDGTFKTYSYGDPNLIIQSILKKNQTT